MITYEEETCQEPLPSKIEIYSARFGGHAVAKCQDCDFTAVSWDCACELEHACPANCPHATLGERYQGEEYYCLTCGETIEPTEH